MKAFGTASTEHEINLYDVDPTHLFLSGPRDDKRDRIRTVVVAPRRLLDMYDAFRSEI